MSQLIEVPAEDELAYIARQWILANQISEELAEVTLNRTFSDLEKLQSVLDRNILTIEHGNQVSAIGIAFGQVFINEVPGYDWWMVEDEYGRDVAVRYKDTSLLIFPESMIANRIEDNIDFTVQELFSDLKEGMANIIIENFQNS